MKKNFDFFDNLNIFIFKFFDLNELKIKQKEKKILTLQFYKALIISMEANRK